MPIHGVGSTYDIVTLFPIEIVLPAEDREMPLVPTRLVTAGAERMMLLFESPTLRAPVALKDRDPAPAAPEEVLTVVFPTAKMLCAPAATVAPEMIRVFDENPTVTAPVPENDIASGSTEEVEDEIVVLPTANKLRLPWLAADVAEITSAPAPAAVVENPTETIPAPETDMLDNVWVVDDVAAVVLPITNSF